MSGSSRYTVNPMVFIGTPTLEKHPLSWAWMDYYYGLAVPLGISSVRYRCMGLPVDEARNDIVRRALELNADYVLFIGDDNLCPAQTFEMLRRHRESMVTGVYWTKTYPSLPYLWNGMLQGPYIDWKVGEFFQVDYAGCDCLLVHTDVFKAMKPPWFSTKWTFEHDRPLHLPTEDFYFYTKAREAGFKLYCDTEVQCDHQDRSTGVRFGLTHEMTRYWRDKEEVEGDRIELLVADLGSGSDTPWFGTRSKVVRFDADPTFGPDVRCDLRHIPEPDDKYDIVHARHVLEHFHPFEAAPLVREWMRILKPGGKMVINVPNLGFAARQILKAEEGEDVGVYPMWQLYGQQMGNANEVHKNGFTKASLVSLLQVSGLDGIETSIVGEDGENVQGIARKPVGQSNRLYAIQDTMMKVEEEEAKLALVETNHA